ncbi:MAG TPA: FtsX-like permease family protein, partial [bacterium]|nr:FtsX-like permease family protein [bacterium]
NVQPHLRIEKIGGVDRPEEDIQNIWNQGIPRLLTVAGFVEGQAILRSEKNATGVIIKGLDTEREDTSIFKQHMLFGELDLSDNVISKTKRKWLLFKRTSEEHQGGIVIGEELAAVLGVQVGDLIYLISPFQQKGVQSLLSGQAESHPFRVRGIFRVGMSDFDSSLALISLSQSQKVYHLGNRVTGIGVRFENVDDAQKWKLIFSSYFSGGYVIRSWYDMNQNFFRALKVEKSVMTILLALIILVAAFNIISTLIMVVMEKTKDIGILRSIGAKRSSIRKIFIFEGFSVGFLGVIGGAILGLLMAYNLNPISDFIKDTTGLEVFPSDIYYFDRIPAEVHFGDVGVIIAFALLASVLAGFYPAHRAAALKPVEALRYE